MNKAKGKEVVNPFNHCPILINIQQSVLDNVFKGESYRGCALFTFEENKFKNVNISLPIGGCIYGVHTACPMVTFTPFQEGKSTIASKTNSYFWSKENFNFTLKKYINNAAILCLKVASEDCTNKKKKNQIKF